MSAEFETWDNEEQEQEHAEVFAPAPVPALSGPWTWSANTLLWVAGAAVALSFGVWFLMSFSKAKAAALAEVVTGNDGSN